MKPLITMMLFGALAATAQCGAATVPETQPEALKVKAPEFQDVTEWVNTKPLSFKDLRGQVVVVHFWTFG